MKFLSMSLSVSVFSLCSAFMPSSSFLPSSKDSLVLRNAASVSCTRPFSSSSWRVSLSLTPRSLFSVSIFSSSDRTHFSTLIRNQKTSFTSRSICSTMSSICTCSKFFSASSSLFLKCPFSTILWTSAW